MTRDSHLAAIRANGLTLVDDQDRLVAHPRAATDRISDLEPQDVVLLAVKAHQIEEVAPDLPVLLGPDTVIVTLQNGIPWWYFQKLPGAYANTVVRAVDPNAVLFNSIDPDRIIGCIAYPAAVVSAPGVIRLVEGNRFPLGELDGQETARVRAVAAAFTGAGFRTRILDDVRSEIWLNLWGNLTFNPISALTHATLVDICQFPLTRQLAASMMIEAQAVGERLEATFRVPMERRISGAEAVGKHETSMLQDVEAGRPLEIGGMLGAVVELAELVSIDVPTLKALYACVSLLDQTLEDERIQTAGITS